MAVSLALTYAQGKPIYAVRNSKNHRLHLQNNTVGYGIYSDYGEAVDNGYLTLAPYNAQTFANARNNLSRNQWEHQITLAQSYIGRQIQPQGINRVITNFAERNYLPKWLVYSGGFFFTIFCFIMAVSGNYILFYLSNKVYKNQECKRYINNTLPACMWANKMKFHLAEHSHHLTYIAIDKLFSFLKSLTMSN